MQKIVVYKYAAIILLVNLFFTNTNAQKKILDFDKESFFRIGAKAGANINKINGTAYAKGFNFNFQAGVFTQFNLTKKIGIQPEVSFVQTTSEFTNDANDVYYDLFLSGTQHKAALNYLEIPVFLNVNIGPTKKVKFQIGPSYGVLLSQAVDSLKVKGNVFKGGEWSAITGLWIQLPVVNISARYKLGLSNINSIDDKQRWSNQAIQIAVGVTF